MRVRKARRRWIVLATILFVAFCLIGMAACTILVTDRAVRIEYYRVVDEHTLVVGAETENRSWTRVTSVVETTTTVTITVRALPPPITLGVDGAGQGLELIVKLRDPIGSRTVVDGSRGQVVEFTRCLPPTTMRPECL
ncbi:MAG: hypothetical protein ABSE70_04630 [Candidatus Limnocylindrales bacterium]